MVPGTQGPQTQCWVHGTCSASGCASGACAAVTAEAGPASLVSGLFDRKRPDVIATTYWRAPIIWEGTFNRQALRSHYRQRNLTVGLAVFAAGRTADQYLELFLQSANKHFMAGYRVVFYIMMEDPYGLPDVQPDPLRTFQVLTIEDDSWWHDRDLVRMMTLGEHIISHIQDEVDFLFSMTVEHVFQGDFGVETLGMSVAQLHAWWYFKDTENVPYERRPQSAACIPFGWGDFFYDGEIVGGTPLQVLKLIQDYLKGVTQDAIHGLNSTYESHLNKYFFLHKPSRLLSPEYSWDTAFHPPQQVQTIKVLRLTRRAL
ncbi:PREDICTED: glycosyltransferase 6 domain-containing protein 1 [Hipposideros armiger]|uniref:Glycosyltransferase 6 domain-containing protein 1 n=1 Tax=Hipposideros armiger TaxID=186990 RepID=A0A8B7RBI8_HIPAR|nr:PREDICTED: glycosyltransferase 6 domain-containing protein 1 [Hipposideros armiger]